MKLKMFILAAILAGGTAFFFGNESSDDNNVSDLQMANVKALSNNESGARCPNGCSNICWGWDKILECDCNYDHFSFCSRWGC